MRVYAFAVAVAFNLAPGCAENAREDSFAEQCGAPCTESEPATCAGLFNAPGSRRVAIDFDVADIDTAARAEVMCDGTLAPVFMVDRAGEIERLCGRRENCALRLCGSVDPKLRDRITHKPIFTVCEMELVVRE